MEIKKFEYLVASGWEIGMVANSTVTNFDKGMEKLGDEGWELVIFNGDVYIFKRPKLTNINE
jgi:hypothetical protein